MSDRPSQTAICEGFFVRQAKKGTTAGAVQTRGGLLDRLNAGESLRNRAEERRPKYPYRYSMAVHP